MAATADEGTCLFCCCPWGTGAGFKVPLGGGVRCAPSRGTLSREHSASANGVRWAAAGSQFQVSTIPGASGMSVRPGGDRGTVGGGGAAAENSPNGCWVPLFSLFLFEKFLLFKPATPNKCLASDTAQLYDQTGDWPGQGPSLPNSSQPASTVSVGAHHPCVFATSSLFLPCDFKRQGPSWCCSNLIWQGREPLTWLSPKNPEADPVGTGPGAAAAVVSLLVPETLLSWSTLLTIWFVNVLYNFWSPVFIYAGILLAVCSVPQKIC